MHNVTPRYLPGIDVEEGLERFSGSWETFSRIMKYFVKSHETIMKDLHEAMCQGEVDYDMIAEMAHKIKGAAANLSAVDLRDRALKLEQSSRSKDDAAVRNDIPSVLNSFYELRDVIENM